MGRGTKRKKSYYVQFPKRTNAGNTLTPGCVGFLCTCNNPHRAIKEAYNLLGEFADKLYGPEAREFSLPSGMPGSSPAVQHDVHDPGDCDEDIEASLKADLTSLRQQSQGALVERRFHHVSSGVNKCLFIATTLPSPMELCVAILDDILLTRRQRTKNIIRMTPVQRVCRASLSDIEKNCLELVNSTSPNLPETTSFCIALKVRNNSAIDKGTALPLVAHAVEKQTRWSVSYVVPDVVLALDVLRTMCCLALLPHYLTKYRKYNLIKLAEDSEEASDEEGGNEAYHKPVSISEEEVMLLTTEEAHARAEHEEGRKNVLSDEGCHGAIGGEEGIYASSKEQRNM